MHRVYNLNDKCQNPSEEDDDKNHLNQCDNYVSRKTISMGLIDLGGIA